MSWTTVFHPAFERDFHALPERVQDAILAQALRLQRWGPSLGRPSVDTLEGSRFANLKELRFAVDRQPWRVAFAFDPARQAVLLCAGAKTGVSSRRFYRRLVSIADERYAAWVG